MSDHTDITIVGLGLGEQATRTVEAALAPGQKLVARSLRDPLDRRLEAMKDARLGFVQWEGDGRIALQCLHEMKRARTDAQREIPVYALIVGDKPSAKMARFAEQVGVVGWIKLPERYFEVGRMLHDVDPAASPDEADPVTLELADDSWTQLTVPIGLAPHPEIVAAEAARELAGDAVALPAELSPARKRFPRLGLLHRDTAFIVGLQRRTGLGPVKALTSAKDALAAARLGLDALLVWFDAEAKEAALALEQLAEARRMPRLPILVLVPGREALTKLAQQHADLFFDAAAAVDMSARTLDGAFVALTHAQVDRESPIGLLGQLRQAFKPDSTPTMKLQISFEEAAAIAAALRQKPGKAFWSHVELIPHALLAGRHDIARTELELATRLAPDSYTTLTMRAVVAHAAGDKAAGGRLAAETLAFPQLTADRLHRSAGLLARWKDAPALAQLLDGWNGLDDLRDDPQLLFAAARYHTLAGKTAIAGALLSRCVRLEPTRPDYLDALAHHVARGGRADLAADLWLALRVRSGFPWDSRVALAEALLGMRRRKEAEVVVAELARLAPEAKLVRELQKKL